MTTQEKLEQLRRSAYRAARSDLDTDHPEGVNCLDIVWEQITQLTNQARKEAAIEELESAQLAVQYHAKSKVLSDKAVILATTQYMKGRIKALREQQL